MSKRKNTALLNSWSVCFAPLKNYMNLFIFWVALPICSKILALRGFGLRSSPKAIFIKRPSSKRSTWFIQKRGACVAF